jgi:hypothetical protein
MKQGGPQPCLVSRTRYDRRLWEPCSAVCGYRCGSTWTTEYDGSLTEHGANEEVE